ncbi:MAG: hypothetical protein R3E38_13740 [Nitrosomonas sp.]|nr:hypothetical protein [Nitrosomonas sp.]
MQKGLKDESVDGDGLRKDPSADQNREEPRAAPRGWDLVDLPVLGCESMLSKPTIAIA